MAAVDASFRVRALGPSAPDRADLDAALSIFTRNTSPLLRTQANQIRQKIRKPNNPHGTFYFLAFYRGDVVIGFAMFGHYPRTRLVAIDHMAIAEGQRGSAAFYVFAQLIRDLTENLGLEVDFAIVEVERHNRFGGDQTGGQDLVRLLGQVGFGEVHMDYVIPNMEPRSDAMGYEGTLMIRGPQKLYSIRREDLVELYRTVVYEHYLPWFRDFLGAEGPGYEDYLDGVFQAFRDQLKETPIVRVNGEEVDQLVAQPRLPVPRTAEVRALYYTATFGICCGVLVAAAAFLKVQNNLLPMIFIALLVVFAGVVAVSSGRAYDVFQLAISSLPGGRHRSRYPQSGGSPGAIGTARRRSRLARPNLDAE
jgi:hypothetical protein